MEQSESPEQAKEFARSALSLMIAKKIATNPNNFTVWFHYFSNKYPDLRRTLEILLSNDQEFTASRNAEIFEKFFTFDGERTTIDGERAAISEAAGNIEMELVEILKYLGLAGDAAAEYGKVLEAFSGEIAEQRGEGELKSLVTSILSSTRDMEARNKKLEVKLNTSSTEVRQLRDDLEYMRHEAMTDALTGIANRKQFDLELKRAAMEAMEQGEELCLLMLDIDHFKKFNDRYGHLVGDQVLKFLGAMLTKHVKGQDTAARYGGEEFCVILPGTGLKDAVKLAEKIRQRVSGKKVVSRKTGEDLGKITISIGVRAFDFGEPPGQLIARSDGALYTAKRNGRDRVVSQDEVQDKELAFGS